MISPHRNDRLTDSPRHHGAAIASLIMLTALLSFVGCKSQKPVVPIPAPMTINQIIADYNARVDVTPAFKANIQQWQVDYRQDPDHSVHHKDIFGHVLFRPPIADSNYASCYLEARTLIDPELILGCNDYEYWFAVKRAKQARWGKYKYLGKPCADRTTLHPQLFLDLAGLRPLPTGDEKSGRPVLKVYPEKNIIEYIIHDDNRYWVKREIFIDRRTALPVEIYIYDKSGNRIVESKITGYDTLDDIPVPAEITLTSGDGDFRFYIKLNRFRILKDLQTPLFNRPKHFAGISEYIQIDQLCDENQTP